MRESEWKIMVKCPYCGMRYTFKIKIEKEEMEE